MIPFQTLVGKANEPVKVDGALRMAGELAAQLTTSKVREEKKIEELMMMCCVNKDGEGGGKVAPIDSFSRTSAKSICLARD